MIIGEPSLVRITTIAITQNIEQKLVLANQFRRTNLGYRFLSYSNTSKEEKDYAYCTFTPCMPEYLLVSIGQYKPD